MRFSYRLSSACAGDKQVGQRPGRAPACLVHTRPGILRCRRSVVKCARAAGT